MSDHVVKEYSATEARLTELRESYLGKVYDVSTSKGMDVAKRDRKAIRALRTDLEATRKQIKAPVIDLGKKIDSEAKRITAELVELERPIDEVIKAEEKRKADIKAEQMRIERERIEAIHAQITEVTNAPLDLVGKSSHEIKVALNELINSESDGKYAEFQSLADQAHEGAIDKIKSMLSERIAHEQALVEQARLRAEAVEKQKKIDEENEKRRLEAAKQQAELDARADAQRKIDEARQAELDVQAEAQRKQTEEKQAELDARQAELDAKHAEIEAANRSDGPDGS